LVWPLAAAADQPRRNESARPRQSSAARGRAAETLAGPVDDEHRYTTSKARRRDSGFAETRTTVLERRLSDLGSRFYLRRPCHLLGAVWVGIGGTGPVDGRTLVSVGGLQRWFPPVLLELDWRPSSRSDARVSVHSAAGGCEHRGPMHPNVR